MIAYLDALSNVVALSTVLHTVQEAQQVNAAIETVIPNAPEGLVTLSDAHNGYHKQTSGDGSLISHYAFVAESPPYLEKVRQERYQEVDAKTETLIKTFDYDGKTFPKCGHSVQLVEALSTVRPQLVEPNDFPIEFPLAGELGSYQITSLAHVDGLLRSYWDTMHAAICGGVDIKVLISQAQTEADIMAVADER